MNNITPITIFVGAKTVDMATLPIVPRNDDGIKDVTQVSLLDIKENIATRMIITINVATNNSTSITPISV